jgi:WhiB family transcriptional regulator, redox-sensing transcriptional regulator
VTSWIDRAACRADGVDPDLFFPVSESGLGARQVAAAKAVCAKCPVAADCLAWALRGEPAGIWGGTTPDERRALRLAQAAQVFVGVGDEGR